MGELRHLRLKRIADKKRRRATQENHRQDGAIGRGFPRQFYGRLQTKGRRLPAHTLIATVTGIRQYEHENDHREIHYGINEKPDRRSEEQHRRAAHRRPEKHGKISSGGIEPDRALEVLAPDDIVDDQLAARRP